MAWGRIRLILASLALIASSTSARADGSQGCPYALVVPGIGTCGHQGGSDCKSCTYYCPGLEIYTWDVCGAEE